MYHYLISIKGRIVKLPLNDIVHVGRDRSSLIQLQTTHASRRHAELFWDGEHFVVMDLQSTNGTRVNDAAIHVTSLNDHDIIEFGEESFLYRIVKTPSMEKTTPHVA